MQAAPQSTKSRKQEKHQGSQSNILTCKESQCWTRNVKVKIRSRKTVQRTATGQSSCSKSIMMRQGQDEEDWDQTYTCLSELWCSSDGNYARKPQTWKKLLGKRKVWPSLVVQQLSVKELALALSCRTL